MSGADRPAGRRAPLLRTVTSSVHGAVDPSALRAEGVDPASVIDFSANQSPLGPTPGVAAAVAGAVVDAYPDPHAQQLVEAAAERCGVPAGFVVAGNGSTELIRLIAQLTLSRGDVAMSLAPSFGECAVATSLCEACFEEVRLMHAGPGAGFRCDGPALHAALRRASPRLCWLCSPDNPTGATLPAALVAALVVAYPDTLFVLDEAYADLLSVPQWTTELLAAGNLLVLRSLTKYWGLAGLRLGYAVGDAPLAGALRAAAPPWSVNACAQAAGVVALRDLTHHHRSASMLVDERGRMAAALRAQGWTTEPSAAGFFLIHVGDAAAARRSLLLRGCLVRDCASFGLPAHVRVSPRRPAQNDRLLAAFAGLSPPDGP